MSFPLTAMGADTAAPAASAGRFAALRWRTQLSLFAGAVVWLLLVLALVTHDAADPAFTTSGAGAALQNRAGLLGAWVSDLAYFLFGFSAWWLVPVALRAGLAKLARGLRGEAPQTAASSSPAQHRHAVFWCGLALLLAASAALEWTRLYRWEPLLPGHAGGVLGYMLGRLSMHWLGFAGSGVLWIATLVAGTALALGFSWLQVADAIGTRFDALRQRRAGRIERAEDRRIGEQAQREREREVDVDAADGAQADIPHPLQPRVQQKRQQPRAIVIEPALPQLPTSERVAKERQQPLFVELSDTRLPQVGLLDAAPGRQESVAPESLEMTSRLIEKKLKDFGVDVRVVAASPGPVITRYEIEPATGVKGSQVVGLAKDLARALSLVSIRVVEVIPGRNTMALELPNARRQTIRLAEILGSPVYNDAASMLTIGLGKDIVGNPVVADLAKMPHCLVAGTTGSGKSVGVNAMILSLLYKAEARDVRLILIDPKMLEMSVYEGIPHLLAPVVTDMKQASNALNWCVGEMERRYKFMSKLGVRNLAGYNKKIADAAAREEHIGNPFSLTPEEPEPLERLPHVVVVIDELADLMMVVGKKIEELIARLAQKARAAGIHLILATQRPSVDVITGLIKANIPTRLSFQVSSKIDSRTILDQMGAEALLGQGDMLYLPPGGGVPVRVHGAFVSDDEVHRVVDYLKTQGEPNYIEGILEGGVLDGEADAALAVDGSAGGGGGESDAMYDNAVAIVLQHKRASISLVQRHLRIGYNRAARLLEQMEKSGLVSAMGHNGNRDLLVPDAGRMKPGRLLVAVALCIAVHAAHADGADALRDFVRDVQSGRAAFTQTVTSPDGARKKTSSGSFEFMRPNRFRFNYMKPFEQLIVGDGQKVWIHDADLNQVSSRKLAQALGSTPAALLAGRSLEQDFTVTAQPAAGGLDWALATPKVKDGAFQSMRVGFRGKLLEQVEIVDSFGQKSLLQFSGFTANATLAAERFQFVVPAGADVVEQ